MLRSRASRRPSLFLAMALGVGAAAPARAEPPTAAPVDQAAVQARAHYQRGTALYDLGKYDEAIAAFEAAYQAKSDPALLYNLAQANRLGGHAEAALRFYRTYLKRVPKVANKAEIEARIAQLEQQLAGAKAASVAPPSASATAPAGASQPPSSAAPAPASVPAPPPSPPPTAAAAPPPSVPLSLAPPSSAPAAPVPAASLDPNAMVTSAPSSSEGMTVTRKVGIGVIAGGAVLLGAGVGLTAASHAKQQDYEDSFKRGTYDPGLQSQSDDYAKLSWAAYGVGAVAVVTGVVLVLVGGRDDGQTVPSTPLAPAPRLVWASPALSPEGGLGAVLSGLF